MSLLSSVAGGLGGGVLGSAVVELGLDTRRLTQGMDGARRQVGAGATDMERKWTVAKGAIIAGAALAGAALVKFGADSVRAFEESQKALLQLSIAVGGNTQAYQDQAHALQELTGFQDEEIMAAQAILARFQLTEQQITDLIPLILDYARATGVDATTAAGNIGRALLGNARALKAVGIQFKATGDTAKDLETIMTALEDRIGGTAEAFGKTFAGQMQILSADFDDFKEKVGELIVGGLKPLLPLMTKFVSLVAKALPLIVAVAAAFVAWKVAAALTTLFLALSAAITGTSTAAIGAKMALDTMAGSLLALKAAAGVAAAALVLTTLGMQTNAQDAASMEAAITSLSDAIRSGTISSFSEFVAMLQKTEPEFLHSLVAMKGQAGALEFLRGMYDKAVTTADRYKFSLAGMTEADQAATAALQEQAAAAREAKDALDSLSGGVLGLAADSRSYLDAQKEVNKLTRAGKDDTRAYEDAVFALAQQGLGLRDDLVSLIDTSKTANASWHDAKQELFGAARQMGLTRDQVKLILGPLGQVRQELGYFNTQLDKLDGRKVNVEIITHYIETGKLA